LLVNQRGTSRACITSAPQRTTAPERGSRKQQQQQGQEEEVPTKLCNDNGAHGAKQRDSEGTCRAIGDQGARSLAAALDNDATLTRLDLENNNIGADGARALAAALDTNRMLQRLDLGYNIAAEIMNLVGERLGVNKLVLKVASWVASAVARRVELWDDALVLPPALAAPLVLPPALAARAAVLAFGDDWTSGCPMISTSIGGHRRAGATWRLPTYCRAPRPRCARSCSGWPTPPRERAKARARPRAARASSLSVSRSADVVA
jgi:hypothetical protein